MKIKIKSRDFSKTVSIKGNKVKDIFEKEKLIQENFVVTKDKKIVLLDEKLKDGDTLILYSVVSGG